MKRETVKPLDEQRHIVAYLDGLQAKVNALPAPAFGRLQSASGEELSPSRRFGDVTQSALMPDVEVL